MMDLNKHIVTNDDSKPFHSNGYARVANGNRLGASAKVSFNQRQQINCNRQIIGGYSRSTTGSAYGVLRAKSVVKDATNRTGIRQRSSLQQRNNIGARPRHFSEPSPQSYNPYA